MTFYPRLLQYVHDGAHSMSVFAMNIFLEVMSYGKLPSTYRPSPVRLSFDPLNVLRHEVCVLSTGEEC